MLRKQIDQFLSSIVGRSPMTKKAYRKGLDFFEVTVGDVDLKHMTYDQFKPFLEQFDEREMSAYSKTLYIGNVKRLLVFHNREDLAKKLKNPKKPRSNRVHVNFKHWDDLIEASGEARNRALVATLLSTGMRLGEARGLRIENIDWREGRVKVRAKGGDDVYYYMITDDIREHLKPYLTGRSHGYCFPGIYKGGCISERYCEHVIRNAAVKAGVPNAEGVSPHSLRHSLANYLLLEMKWDLKVIQQVLNHKSIATTSLYTNATSQELTDFIKKNRNF